MEHPEYWLTFGSPWEIERDDIQYEIQYYGSLIEECDAYGNCIVSESMKNESVEKVGRHAESDGRGLRYADQWVQHQHNDQSSSLESHSIRSNYLS